HGRPGRAAEQGAHRTVGNAAHALCAAGDDVRRQLHRHARHEPAAFAGWARGGQQGTSRARRVAGRAARSRHVRLARAGAGEKLRIPGRGPDRALRGGQRVARPAHRRRPRGRGGQRDFARLAGSQCPSFRFPGQTHPKRRHSMKRKMFNRVLVGAAAAATFGWGAAQAQAPTEISFFYPVAVGGPIAKFIDGMAADFMKANPSIKVNPIHAGTYQETIVKALTAHKSGTPPVTPVLLSTDMFTLVDEDAIVPIDGFVKTADDKAWMNSFYKAFLFNSQSGGKTWGVPFQRSTVVMYWNKEAFKEAGLDPNKAPQPWAE